MSAFDDFKAAFADEENAVDQAVGYINTVPDLLSQAFAAGAASNDAALATLTADAQAHGQAIKDALTKTTTPPPPAPSPTA